MTGVESMKRIVPRGASFLGAFLAAAGCAGPVRYARPAFEKGNYEEAVVRAERALREHPGDPELQSLLGAAKTRAVEERYRRAREALAALRFDEALAYLEGIREIDPGASGSPSLEEVTRRREEIERQLEQVRSLIEAKRWKEAVSVGEGLAGLEERLPEAAEVLEAARRGRSAELCGEAESLLERGDLDGAERLLGEAHAHWSASPRVHEDQVLLDEERHLRSLEPAFAAALGVQEHRKARAIASRALAVRPSNPDWKERHARAGKAWAAALYTEAAEAMLREDREGWSRALERLQATARVVPDDRDVASRVEEARASLAAVLERDAQRLAKEGLWGQAVLFLAAAARLGTERPGLAPRLDEAKKVLKARRQYFVSISAQDLPGAEGDGYADDVAQALRAALAGAGIPDLNVVDRQNLEEKAQEQTFAQLFGSDFKLEIRPATMALALKVLEKGVRREGYDKPAARTSEYKAGTRLVPNPEYQRAVNRVHQARREVEERQRARNQAESEFQRAKQALDGATQYDWVLQTRFNEANWSFSQAEAQLNEAKERLRAEEDALASTPQSVEEDVIRKYTYHEYRVAARASVKVAFDLVDNQTTLFKASEAVEAAVSDADTFTRGVKAEDVRGLVEDRDDLRDAAALLAAAKEAAARRLQEAVIRALRSQAEKYLRMAREALRTGRRAEAVERCVDYLYATADLAARESLEADRMLRELTGFSFLVPAGKVLPVTDETPVLGVEVAASRDLPGVRVVQVAGGSAAARAGLEPGDVIFALDLEPVRSVAAFLNAVRSRRPGTAGVLQLWRGPEIRWLDVKLERRGRKR